MGQSGSINNGVRELVIAADRRFGRSGRLPGSVETKIIDRQKPISIVARSKSADISKSERPAVMAAYEPSPEIWKKKKTYQLSSRKTICLSGTRFERADD